MVDVWTVIRKEWLEQIHATRRQRFQVLFGAAMVLGVPAFVALSTRSYWLSISAALGLGTFQIVMYSLLTAGDTFAGERERHTLETLLASRLSNDAIFFGKLLAVVVGGLALGTAAQVVGLLIVTALFGQWVWLPMALLLMLPFLLVGAQLGVLLGGISLMVSMRAATVKQAMQIASLIMAFLFLVPPLIPVLAVQLLGPEALQDFFLSLRGVNWPFVLGIVGLTLLAIDGALVMAGRAMCKRPRLMLA